jgi:hypothetical protein
MIGPRSGSALALSFLIGGLLNSAAWGTTIQFQTMPGATVGGEPVSARATFTTSTDTVSIKLENLQADPISVKSVIYDVMFSLSTGQNTGTITSTTGVERTVSVDGNFSDSGLINLVDWGLFTSGSQLDLDRIQAAGQKHHGVIGPPNSVSGEYDNAGGSIADNNAHDPFWGESVDFVLNVPGVTAASTITAATLSFNTTSGNTVTVVPVPEPAGWALACLAVSMLSLSIFGKHRLSCAVIRSRTRPDRIRR